MAFDFGGRRPSGRGSSGGGMNMDPMTGKTEPMPPQRSNSSSGGGFVNLPKRHSDDGGFGENPARGWSPSNNVAGFGGIRPSKSGVPKPSRSMRNYGRARYRSGFSMSSVPVLPILMMLAVIGILAVLWYFRYEIAAFLAMVLAWLIVIVVVVVVLRLMLFSGRR